MTHPPLDEPWQQPRAIKYGRSNQAKSHYRPKQAPGRVTPSRSQATSYPAATSKATNHRRIWFFTIALLLALAFGAAMFKAVLAGPAPMAGPSRPAPPTTPVPTTAPATPPAAAAEPAAEVPAADEPVEDGPADADAPPEEPASEVEPQRDPTTPATAIDDSDADTDTAAVSYKNCGQARKAGAAPMNRDDPGYSAALDRDGDGVACERNKP